MQKKEKLYHVCIILVSMIVGYLCYWYISMDIINRLYNLDHILKVLFLLLCHCTVFYVVFKLILNREFYTIEKKSISIIYLILLFIVFFDRVYIGQRIINVNPFTFLQNFEILSTILNIIIFIPFFTVIHWLFPNHKNTLLLFIGTSCSIELLQYITMSGIFDVCDLLFYTIGFCIGILFYNYAFTN